jgi:hypothetical protein
MSNSEVIKNIKSGHKSLRVLGVSGGRGWLIVKGSEQEDRGGGANQCRVTFAITRSALELVDQVKQIHKGLRRV